MGLAVRVSGGWRALGAGYGGVVVLWCAVPGPGRRRKRQCVQVALRFWWP